MTKLGLALVGLIALPGCFSLSRVEPPQQHYVLGGGRASGEELPASVALSRLAIGVRRLDLASYLQTPLIVVRRGEDEIGFSEYHRWGESLDGGINQAVSSYLSRKGRFRAVDVAPWSAGERYDFLIQMHVLHFEGLTPVESGESLGEVHLLANWEILLQQTGAVVARGTTDYRERDWTPGNYSALVKSLDDGLDALANDLVASLTSLAQAASDGVATGPDVTSGTAPPR
jgi:uncharacterized lipoprotein YmbA